MKCSKDAFWKCLKWYISKTIIVLTILFLFILLQISGGKEMMAMLWAQEIMNQETVEEWKNTTLQIDIEKCRNKLKISRTLLCLLQ